MLPAMHHDPLQATATPNVLSILKITSGTDVEAFVQFDASVTAKVLWMKAMPKKYTLEEIQGFPGGLEALSCVDTRGTLPVGSHLPNGRFLSHHRFMKWLNEKFC
jgi:hypothetical protein